MTSMLDFKDVELYYDHVYALKGVSLNVNKGETVALIGANGAGKSSILRAITGLAKPAKGSVTFEGKRIDGADPSDTVRGGIAMVPEGRRVFPFMSIKDNLMMGAFTRTDKGEIADTLDSILTRFPRLKERYSQAAGTLSGGEQQMMVIGRALMAKPKLLLLDEPSLGIAPKLVQDIARSIVAINRDEGVSVLLVEQDAQIHRELQKNAQLQHSLNERDMQLNELDLKRRDLESQLELLQKHSGKQSQHVLELEQRLNAIYDSTSWKLMGPVRRVTRALASDKASGTDNSGSDLYSWNPSHPAAKRPLPLSAPS